jgi:hypothetical protein
MRGDSSDSNGSDNNAREDSTTGTNGSIYM